MAQSTSRTTTVLGRRIDWKDIKDQVDLARVVTALLGPAPKRQGRRLLWCCPFHEDRHPSLEVDPQRGRWRCWPCALGGDAIELVMRHGGTSQHQSRKQERRILISPHDQHWRLCDRNIAVADASKDIRGQAMLTCRG